MDTSFICSSLYKEILEGKLRGRVHSVFNNSFNVLDENHRLITFINSNISMGPNAIQIKGTMSFSNSKISPKLKLSFYDSYVLVEDLNIKITYGQAQSWDKYPIFNYKKAPRENICKKLEEMNSFLGERAKTMGIFPLLRTLEGKVKNMVFPQEKGRQLRKEDQFIKGRFLKFMDSYLAEDVDSLTLDGKNIIGFGKGLTPSMDDFLAGLMLARLYCLDYLGLDLEEGKKLNAAIIKEVKDRTTLVSQEMLINAAQGITNEDIRFLLLSLFGDYSQAVFLENMERAIRIGETSGSDTLSGIYTGISIGLKK